MKDAAAVIYLQLNSFTVVIEWDRTHPNRLILDIVLILYLLLLSCLRPHRLILFPAAVRRLLLTYYPPPACCTRRSSRRRVVAGTTTTTTIAINISIQLIATIDPFFDPESQRLIKGRQHINTSIMALEMGVILKCYKWEISDIESSRCVGGREEIQFGGP